MNISHEDNARCLSDSELNKLLILWEKYLLRTAMPYDEQMTLKDFMIKTEKHQEWKNELVRHGITDPMNCEQFIIYNEEYKRRFNL